MTKRSFQEKPYELIWLRKSLQSQKTIGKMIMDFVIKRRYKDDKTDVHIGPLVEICQEYHLNSKTFNKYLFWKIKNVNKTKNLYAVLNKTDIEDIELVYEFYNRIKKRSKQDVDLMKYVLIYLGSTL